MAAKQNASASDIDKTSFWWTGLCAVCHPGGGPSEFDRDGRRYYDVKTATYGWQGLGKTAADVALDGDYCEVVTGGPTAGTVRNDLWAKTGVVEPDCLYCHRTDRTIATNAQGQKMNMNWIWRAATLRAKDGLYEDAANKAGPVPAFAASATAAQGWFDRITLGTVPAGQPPLATELVVDYGKGVADGSLVEETDGTLRLNPGMVRRAPTDYSCWGCHVTPELRKRGWVWFDATKDVHYARFNNLDDGNPSNDVSDAQSIACSRCHPSGADHQIAKGATTLGSVRDDVDYLGFRACRECHAAAPGGEALAPTSPIHTESHLAKLACEACHVPYKSDATDLVIDNATTGSSIIHSTARYLSEDPLDPRASGDARWYPDFRWKKEADGVNRLFPMKTLLSLWWGDWNDAGTPADPSDDVVRPIALWRVRQVVTTTLLAGIADDDGDGAKEVNRADEILLYLAALRGPDSHGTPVATRPVLVKGGRIWFEDGIGGVTSFEFEGTGLKAESNHPFAADHNVLPASKALGAGGVTAGCADCHAILSGQAKSRVFDRAVLLDPFDAQGQPVYRTVADSIGYRPPF